MTKFKENKQLMKAAVDEMKRLKKSRSRFQKELQELYDRCRKNGIHVEHRGGALYVPAAAVQGIPYFQKKLSKVSKLMNQVRLEIKTYEVFFATKKLEAKIQKEIYRAIKFQPSKVTAVDAFKQIISFSGMYLHDDGVVADGRGKELFRVDPCTAKYENGNVTIEARPRPIHHITAEITLDVKGLKL